MSRSFTTRGTTRTIGIGREIVRDWASGIGVGPSGSAPFFGRKYHLIPIENPNNCSGSLGPNLGKISLIFLS